MRKVPGMAAAREALLVKLGKAIAGLQRLSRAEPAIHEVRKDLKRVRAALRLLRGCLGDADYRWDDTLIREAARPLTPMRDANVLYEAFRNWDRHEDAKKRGTEMSRLDLALSQEYRSAQSHLNTAALEHAAAVLTAIRGRAAALTPRRLSRQSPGEALKRTYKAGLKTFARARARNSDERLHEWRKQSQYFASQIEILLPLDLPRRFAKGRKRAARLAEYLGEDHDLALLTRRISELSKLSGASHPDKSVGVFIERVARRRRRLQRRSFRLGAKLYSAKPARYKP
jgi:CHAD domain-containing protein